MAEEINPFDTTSTDAPLIDYFGFKSTGLGQKQAERAADAVEFASEGKITKEQAVPAFISGNSKAIEDSMASMETLKVNEARQSVIRDFARIKSEQGGSLTPQELQVLQNLSRTDLQSPQNALERAFAKKALATQLSTEAGQMAIQESPKAMDEMDVYEDINTTNAFLQKKMLEVDSDVERQGWGSWLADTGSFLIPAYEWVKMRNVVLPTDAVLPGNNLQEQIQYIWSLPVSERNQKIEDVVEDLKKSNLQLARIFIGAVMSTSTQDTFTNNIFGVLDAGDIALTGLAVAGGVRLNRLRKALQSSTAAIANPRATVQSVVNATGNATAAAVASVSSVAKRLRGDYLKDIKEFRNYVDTFTPSLVNPTKEFGLSGFTPNLRSGTLNDVAEILETNVGAAQRLLTEMPNINRIEPDSASWKTFLNRNIQEVQNILGGLRTHTIKDISVLPASESTQRVSTIAVDLARPSGDTFVTPQAANFWAKNVWKLPDNAVEIVQVGNEYVARYKTPMREDISDIYDDLLIDTQTKTPNRWSNQVVNFFRSSMNPLSPSTRSSRLQLSNTFAPIADLMDVLQRPINRLSNKEGKRVQALLNAARDRGIKSKTEGFAKNIAEFELEYISRFKQPASAKEVAAYFTAKQLMDVDYLVRNHALYAEKNALGVRQHTIGRYPSKDAPTSVATYTFEGRIVKSLPEYDQRLAPRIYDADSNSIVDLRGKSRIDFDAIRFRYQTEGYRIVEIYHHTSNPLKEILEKANGYNQGRILEPVQFVVSKNMRTKPINVKQLDYRDGVHVRYLDNNFIKVPIIVGNRYYGDTTVMSARWDKDGRDTIKFLNQARILYKAELNGKVPTGSLEKLFNKYGSTVSYKETETKKVWKTRTVEKRREVFATLLGDFPKEYANSHYYIPIDKGYITSEGTKELIHSDEILRFVERTKPSWFDPVDKMLEELSYSLDLSIRPKLYLGKQLGHNGMAFRTGEIVLSNTLNKKDAVAVALHEFGHQVEFHLLNTVDKETRNKITEAYNTFVKQSEGITNAQTKPIRSDHLKKGFVSKKATIEYNRSFTEWFAEQVSRWITTNEEPTSVVDKFFKNIAKYWKTIYEKVIGHVPLSKEVDEFMRGRWRPLIETVEEKFQETVKVTKDINLSGQSTRFPIDIGDFKAMYHGPNALDIKQPFTLLKSGTRYKDLPEFKNLNVIDMTSRYSLGDSIQLQYLGERGDGVSSVKSVDGSVRYGPILERADDNLMDAGQIIQQALGSIIDTGFFSDYRIKAINEWIVNFSDVFTETVDQMRKAPLYYLNNPPWNEAADPELLSRAKWHRDSTLMLSAEKTGAQKTLEHGKSKILNSIRNKFGKDYADWFDDNGIFKYRDPVRALKSLAFHSKLGLFNPVHFWLNLTTLTHLTAVSPKGAAQAFRVGYIMHPAMHNRSQKMYDKMLRMSGMNPDHFRELYDGVLESGWAHMHAKGHNYAEEFGNWRTVTNSVGRLLDKGTFFFREGERLVRKYAYTTAYMEWRNANPTAMFDNTAKQFVTNRTNTLTVDMTNASANRSQQGLVSVPLQFMSYQMRLAEEILSGIFTNNKAGVGLTRAEALRSMAAYSALYGLPIGFGIPMAVVPLYDMVNKVLISEGIDPEQTIYGNLFMNGMAQTFSEAVLNTKLNIAERYGPGSLTQINDATNGEVTLLEVLMGPGGSVAMDFIKSAKPGLAYLMAAFNNDQLEESERIKVTGSDLMDFARNISTVNNALKGYYALQFGKYISKNEIPMADDLDWKDAIGIGIFGLTPTEATRTYSMREILSSQRDASIEAARQVDKEIQRMLRTDDLAERAALRRRAYLWLELSDVDPLERRAIMQRALSRYMSEPDRIEQRMNEVRSREQLLKD